jgi:hypothetical protein
MTVSVRGAVLSVAGRTTSGIGGGIRWVVFGERFHIDQDEQLSGDLFLEESHESVGIANPQRPIIIIIGLRFGIGVQPGPEPGRRLSGKAELPCHSARTGRTDL